MRLTRTLRALITAGFSLPLFGGCGESQPPASPPAAGAPTSEAARKPAPDPDDKPITEADVVRPKDFPAAVARLRGYRDSIRSDVTSGQPTKAHQTLDEQDVVLNWLPAIARDSGVPKDRWEEVNTTAQRLQELFNKVHGQIDAKQNPDYAAIAADVDQAIERLGAVPARGPDAPKGAGAAVKTEPGK
jgi:hypothetical protein